MSDELIVLKLLRQVLDEGYFDTLGPRKVGVEGETTRGDPRLIIDGSTDDLTYAEADAFNRWYETAHLDDVTWTSVNPARTLWGEDAGETMSDS